MALSYFVNRKKTTCVITFNGSLSPNDAESLEACLKEATKEPARYTILNFGGLKQVEAGSSRPFTLFQQEIRAGSKLFLCDLGIDVALTLKAEGVVRENEILPDLMSCLQAILNQEKG